MRLSKEDTVHVEEYLAGLSIDDLTWILNRFCGANNYLISVKKFGFPMPKKLVEQELMERILLGKDQS